MPEDFTPEKLQGLLRAFFSASSDGKPTFKQERYSFAGMELSIKWSTGIGKLSKIPTVAFLGDGQNVSNGIYPVILYYPQDDLALLCYGISQTNRPNLSWPDEIINNKSTTESILITRNIIKNYIIGNNKLNYSESIVYTENDIFKELMKNQDRLLSFYSMLEGLCKEYKNILKPYVPITTNQNNQNSFTHDIKSPLVGDAMQTEYFMKKNIILYGPPGTGKTYRTVQYAVAIIENKPLDKITREAYGEVFKRYKQYQAENRIAFTTFHQSFGYEDFIEGIRPVMTDDLAGNAESFVKYKVKDGIFKEFCKNEPISSAFAIANRINNSNRVFVIDEINRGNISKIFGELITLIEPSKRIGASEEQQVILPYSGKAFGIPENLYIIGTMNTADRSLARLDTALRRRFDFEAVYPDPRILTPVEDIDLAKMLAAINKRIAVLYDREHCIGHSYFININNLGELAKVFKNRILPLLEDYFFDDPEKILLVLGNAPFFARDNFEEDQILNNLQETNQIPNPLKLNESALENKDNYKIIYRQGRGVADER